MSNNDSTPDAVAKGPWQVDRLARLRDLSVEGRRGGRGSALSVAQALAALAGFCFVFGLLRMIYREQADELASTYAIGVTAFLAAAGVSVRRDRDAVRVIFFLWLGFALMFAIFAAFFWMVP